MASAGSRGPIVLVVVAAAAVAAWLVFLFTWHPDEPEPVARRAPPAAAPPPIADAPPAAAGSRPADYTLRLTEPNVLAAADLPRDRPVALDLALPVAPRRDDPFPVRIVDAGGRELRATARVVAGEENARLEIDAAWLAKGEYLIHVKTDEPSHRPLRRYPLEVR